MACSEGITRVCEAQVAKMNVYLVLTFFLSASGGVSSPTPILPSVPSHLLASPMSSRIINLSWERPEDEGSTPVIGYRVKWKEVFPSREVILNNTNTTALNINIIDLKSSTMYEFSVLAYNTYGAGPEKTVRARTKETLPRPPADLEAEALTSTSLRVSWKRPPSDPSERVHHPIVKYQLTYYRVGEDAQEVSVDVAGVTFTITGLYKYAQYSVRVVAHNNNGPGLSTPEVVIRTLSDVPSRPPLNVTLEVTSSTSINVHWQPPPPDYQNGVITGYKIRYKWQGDKSIQRKGRSLTAAGNRRAFALTDLRVQTTYQVRLQAVTVNGTGPPSRWFSAKTLLHDLDESIVPGQPTSLWVRPMAKSIVVSWTPPKEKNILIRGYTLGYGMGIPDVYKQVLEANQRWHTIKNLKPQQQYVISLRAFNSIGEGRPTYETVYTRKEDAKDTAVPIIPPVGLKAKVISSSTVIVSWSDSTLHRNQQITDNRYYTVKYNAKVGKRKTRHVNSTELKVHVHDLRPSTEYEFSVMVVKNRRRSMWSLSVFNRTFEAAPTSAPRDLTPNAVDGRPRLINLSWQPPRHANGQIIGYLVFYTTDATLHDRDWVVDQVEGQRLVATVRDLSPQTTYYFKVQARNKKGYGPMSPTVIYHTPRRDGTGGGKIVTPDDHGPHYNTVDTGGQTAGETTILGLPPRTLWIVIGCVVGVTLVTVIIITAVFCRRRQNRAKRNNRLGNYKSSTKIKGAITNHTYGTGQKELKPPDLWINQVENLELQKLDKSGSDTNMTMTPIPRDSQELKGYEDPGMPLLSEPDIRRSSFITDRPDLPPPEERYHRPIALRAKPIMIPVDQPPPREPIATAMPNGHTYLSNGELASQAALARPVYPRVQHMQHSSVPRVNAAQLDQGPPSVEDVRGSAHQLAPPIPPLPVQQGAVTSTPVKGHRHHHHHGHGGVSTLERRREKARSQRKQSQSTGSLVKNLVSSTSTPPSESPLQSPSLLNQQAPIPYEKLTNVTPQDTVDSYAALRDVTSVPRSTRRGLGGARTPPTMSSGAPFSYAPLLDGHKSLPHAPHPLRTFNVSGTPPLSMTSPCGMTAPGTPVARHIVRNSGSSPAPPPPGGDVTGPTPQSPYRSPAGAGSAASRSPLPVITPKAPDVTLRSQASDRDTDSDLPRSDSHEELSAEMANLDCLMKDLNAITQQEFEC